MEEHNKCVTSALVCSEIFQHLASNTIPWETLTVNYSFLREIMKKMTISVVWLSFITQLVQDASETSENIILIIIYYFWKKRK